jgi:hypothetical protein
MKFSAKRASAPVPVLPPLQPEPPPIPLSISIHARYTSTRTSSFGPHKLSHYTLYTHSHMREGCARTLYILTVVSALLVPLVYDRPAAPPCADDTI